MALDQLGPYQLKDILGRGGMGTVYRAVHEETGENCAVKALAPVYTCDEHFRNRFESEIKALIQLDHPNIVRLIGYGQDEGNLFFAMELVEGNSLFQMQRQGHQFGWLEILNIARDLSNGLRHAHDRGIIHRDLKPGNVLRSTDGVNKITDFGIAKSFGGEQITGDNVLGTMDFMSPEQAKGKPVTARSDLYSLGTMLWTLLSGKPPFKANSVEQSLRNLTRVPPPRISTVVPNVPIEIDSIIRKLMDKDPEKRIPTSLALLKKLDEVEERLKDYSEAKTSQQPYSPEETFESSDKRNQSESLASSKTYHNTVDEEQGREKSRGESTYQSEQDDVRSRYVDPSTQKDYFNTVTEEQRDHAPLPEEETKSRGLLPLLLGLAVVAALTGYGLYSAFSVPAADDLYQTISASATAPDHVRDEIDQFLKTYPDDQRIAEIKTLDGIVDAIAVHNNIAVRRRMTGVDRVSELEDQFFEIVELSRSDPSLAYTRLSAFITLHKNSELPDAESKCVEAASGYLAKLERESSQQLEFSRGNIEAAFDKAAKAEPAEAREILESIISLYGDKEWAADLVSAARKRLESLDR